MLLYIESRQRFDFPRDSLYTGPQRRVYTVSIRACLIRDRLCSDQGMICMAMTRGVLCGLSFILPALLAGCASSNIRPDDMSKLGAAPTQQDVDKIAHGKPIHRVDYLVDGRGYSFEVYEASDTARYYQLLFQDGKLIAVDLALGDAGPANCMKFPASPDLDVEDCLRTENQDLQTASIDLHQPVTPDQAAQHGSGTETAETAVEGVTMLGMMAVIAPAVATLEVLSLPIMGVEAAGEKSAQGSIGVKLGDSYQAIQARVEQYPERDRSVKDGAGTVLVPSSFSSIPAAAFGVQGGKVIWLELDPPSECGNGFMFWGLQCNVRTMPAQPAEPWHARNAPRPPVMDEWENLAIYYTPPAQFDLLGETRGSATRAFSGKSRMQHALEEMKEQGLKDGATAVLMYPDGKPFTAAPAAGTGMPVYGPTGDAGFFPGFISGLEIYVPADADAFQKAAQLHAGTCDTLSKKKDAADDAYDAVKDAKGTPEALAAAKQTLQAAKDAKDAAYCGDDDWYAEQMVGHEL